MSKPQTEHLATVLTRYVSGSAISMGGPCNIDPDNPYTVIDLSGLPDDLMLPWVYAATGFATDIILQNGDVGTALLSDELWKLVGAHSNPLAADYTVRMVKLIRHCRRYLPGHGRYDGAGRRQVRQEHPGQLPH